MRLIVSNNSLKVKNMHIPFPIVVLESHTICPVPMKSIHGYEGQAVHCPREEYPTANVDII